MHHCKWQLTDKPIDVMIAKKGLRFKMKNSSKFVPNYLMYVKTFLPANGRRPGTVYPSWAVWLVG